MNTEFGENNIYTEYIIELFFELMVRINNEKKSTLNPNQTEFLENFKVNFLLNFEFYFEI